VPQEGQEKRRPPLCINQHVVPETQEAICMAAMSTSGIADAWEVKVPRYGMVVEGAEKKVMGRI
jgi:hypothetical protein